MVCLWTDPCGGVSGGDLVGADEEQDEARLPQNVVRGVPSASEEAREGMPARSRPGAGRSFKRPRDTDGEEVGVAGGDDEAGEEGDGAGGCGGESGAAPVVVEGVVVGAAGGAAGGAVEGYSVTNVLPA